MGGSSSKTAEDEFQQRANSIRKSSKAKRASQSKAEQIENIAMMAGNMQNEIDIFAGNRGSERYREFQKILATFATELQQLKHSSKKQQQRDRSDEVQGQIQNCLQRLETRVSFNEQNENALDLGSVESHSFINHNFNRPPPPALLDQKPIEVLPPSNKQRQPKYDSFKTLENIEKETHNLEKEIKLSIELEDTKQFIIYENKIKILYTDLELIRVDENTPLSEKKASIGKKLIKCNNQLKRFKRNLEKKTAAQASTQDGAAQSKPTNQKREESQLDDFSKFEHVLSELEMQALTFEGVKGEKGYKELEQVLESHWTKVYSMDAFGDSERRRKSITIDRIKNIMQELRKRADENERQLKAITSIHKIDQQFQGLKKEAAGFQGATKDSNYLRLDQDLRGLWAKLSEVEEPNEHVRRSKARVISDIQHVLKALSQDSKNRESKIYENAAVVRNLEVTKSPGVNQNAIDEEILQNQLLKQVEEFQNHWNQLNYNLDVQKITKSEISKAITDILEKILDGVGKKSNALSIIEKRKSNSSLVIAKVIDNTDLMMKLQPTYEQKTVAQTTVTSTQNYYENHKILTSFQPSTSVTYQSYYHPPDLIQQQTVSPPLAKPMETEIKVQPTVKTIGEMQRVGTEAKFLLQQIRQSNCSKHDSEYKRFEAKLQQCKTALESIEYNKRSDTIESNRRRASKTISEAFRALEEKSSPKSVSEQEKTAAIRSSTAQEFMDIDAGIQYSRQQIKNFSGVTKDKLYEKIKQGLTDCLTHLQIIDDIHMSKQESIRQIQKCHQELETKLAENQAKVKMSEKNAEVRRQTSQDLKGIIEQVQKLRSQVDRFSGVYDGLHYKQIEENLVGCLEKLEAIDSRGDERLENAKMQTNQKIQKYLRILEDKSTKTSIPEQTALDSAAQDPAKPNQKPYQEHVVKEEVQHQKAFSVSLQPQQDQQQAPAKEEQIQLKSAAPTHQEVVRRQKIQRQSQVIEADSPHYKINFLRDKLVEIKNKTETFSGKFKDENYSDIEKELWGCFEELKGIDDRGHKSVILSKEQYADYIEKLMQYFEDKTKIAEAGQEEELQEVGAKVQKAAEVEETKNHPNQLHVKQSTQKFQIVDPTEDLAVIEEEIKEIQKQLHGFEAANGELYKNIEQALTLNMVKLESVEAGNVAHVRERKRKLAQELQSCMKTLEGKAKNQQEVLDSTVFQEQMEKIQNILHELEEISKEVNSFVGIKNDREYSFLDETLIKLTIQLDNIETYGNSELRNARKKAIQEIQRSMKILAQRAAPKDGVELTASKAL